MDSSFLSEFEKAVKGESSVITLQRMSIDDLVAIREIAELTGGCVPWVKGVRLAQLKSWLLEHPDILEDARRSKFMFVG